MASTQGLEKPEVEIIDHRDVALKAVSAEAHDYSGAAAKSDPAEIALVRKLDMRIMPMLWAMYFLNYVSVFAASAFLTNSPTARQECHSICAAQQA
jgi:hypothetical protein